MGRGEGGAEKGGGGLCHVDDMLPIVVGVVRHPCSHGQDEQLHPVHIDVDLVVPRHLCKQKTGEQVGVEVSSPKSLLAW